MPVAHEPRLAVAHAQMMTAMEQRIAALEGRSWAANFAGGRWMCSHLPSLLLFLVTISSLTAHAVLSFIVFFMGPDGSYDKSTSHRAYAAARSVAFGLLILNLAESGAIWWGARIFLACFLFALCCELGNQVLVLPVALGLLFALGFGDLAGSGWPVELLPFIVGGAVCASLLADHLEQWVGNWISGVWMRRCGAALGLLWWYFGTRAFTGCIWAGLAPLAMELVLLSAGLDVTEWLDAAAMKPTS